MAGVIRAHSFAVLTSVATDGELYATHLPFVFKPDEGKHGTLYGHISARNPQVQCLNGTCQSMAVFNGPHAYISASWYNEPARRVPTWNYISVKAKGLPQTLPKAQWFGEMALLIDAYEPDAAWQLSEAEDYTQRLMSGITYFKMPIDEIEGVSKLSSGKDNAENENVIRELRLHDEAATADAMQAKLDKDTK